MEVKETIIERIEKKNDFNDLNIFQQCLRKNRRYSDKYHKKKEAQEIPMVLRRGNATSRQKFAEIINREVF